MEKSSYGNTKIKLGENQVKFGKERKNRKTLRKLASRKALQSLYNITVYTTVYLLLQNDPKVSIII